MKITNDLDFTFTFKDYESTQNAFIGLCEQCNINQNKIAFFGNVGFPGISDIDALIVSTPEKIKKFDSLFNQQRIKSKQFEYLFCHSPVYVFENIAHEIGRLHTLQGLYPVKKNTNFLDFDTVITDKERVLLNVVWFICIITLVADMLNKREKGIANSLRLIMLVYKNIIHSAREFSGTDDSAFNALMDPNDFREWVKNNYNSSANEYVWDNFLTAFDFTLGKFDIFCDAFANEEKKNYPMSIFLSKNKLYKKSKFSNIKVGRYLTKIYINSFAYGIVKDYYNGVSDRDEMNNYIKVSNFFKNEFANVSMPYSFLEPFIFPSSNFKKKLIFGINKVNLVFDTVRFV